MNDEHVRGSPATIRVCSSTPAIDQMTVTGAGTSHATAGVEAELRVAIFDSFGNPFEDATGRVPCTFELSCANATQGQSDGTEKKKNSSNQRAVGGGGGNSADAGEGGGGKGGSQAKKGSGGGKDARATTPVAFVGKLAGNVYSMRYVAQEARSVELHVFAVPHDANGAPDPEQRMALPSSPFLVEVSGGKASATASLVSVLGSSSADSSKAAAMEHETSSGEGSIFVAGERITLRTQLCDAYGNEAVLADGVLTAHLTRPNDSTTGSLETLGPPLPKGGANGTHCARASKETRSNARHPLSIQPLEMKRCLTHAHCLCPHARR